MDWFKGCSTESEIKKQWHKLCRQHHPDLLGLNATEQAIKEATVLMQEINAAYEQALKADYTTNQGYTASKAEWRWEMDQEIMEKAVELMKATQDLKVEICGLWIWITGNTRAAKEQLKAVGCRWSPNKSAWYWRREQDRAWKRSRRTVSLDEIRARYGSYAVEEPTDYAIA